MSAPNTSSRMPTIPWARLSYPHLFEPRAVTSQGKEIGDARFSATLHLDNTPPEYIQMIQQAIVNAFLARWPDQSRRPPMQATVGGNPFLWTNTIPGFIRVPLVWGPAEKPDDPNATGWMLLTTAQADSPPEVRVLIPQPDGSYQGSVALQDRALVYPGAECNASIGIYAYPKPGKTSSVVGISCGLNGVGLTCRDLGRFDSKPTASQMFGGSAAPPPVAGQQAPSQPASWPAPPGGQVPQQGYAPPQQPQQGYAPPQQPPQQTYAPPAYPQQQALPAGWPAPPGAAVAPAQDPGVWG